MKTVTQATKEIETKISDESWDRQTRWQIRREIFFEMVSVMSKFHRATVAFDAIGAFPKDSTLEEKDRYNAKHREIEPDWTAALEEISSIRLLASLKCGAETLELLKKYEDFGRGLGGPVHLLSGVRHQHVIELRVHNRAVLNAMRRELQIPNLSPMNLLKNVERHAN